VHVYCVAFSLQFLHLIIFCSLHCGHLNSVFPESFVIDLLHVWQFFSGILFLGWFLV